MTVAASLQAIAARLATFTSCVHMQTPACKRYSPQDAQIALNTISSLSPRQKRRLKQKAKAKQWPYH